MMGTSLRTLTRWIATSDRRCGCVPSHSGEKAAWPSQHGGQRGSAHIAWDYGSVRVLYGTYPTCVASF
jgi:hypothetical protein